MTVLTYLARSGLSPHFCGRLSRSGYHLAGGRITSKLPTAISSAKLQYREEYFILPVRLTISYSRHNTTTQQASRHIFLAPKRHRSVAHTQNLFCEGVIYPLTHEKSCGRPGEECMKLAHRLAITNMHMEFIDWVDNDDQSKFAFHSPHTRKRWIYMWPLSKKALM